MSLVSGLVEAALKQARGVSTSKTASAPVVSSGTELTKEAEQLADALEFISGASLGENDPRAEVVKNFFKAAAGESAAGGPAASSTNTPGGQGQAVDHSKKKILGNQTGDRPATSEAPGGSMSRSVMEQAPPAVKPTPTDKKANGTSMYDMLMSGQQPKTAASGGPVVSEAGEDAAAEPAKNENKNVTAILGSNEGPVKATAATARDPGRARAAEIWQGAKDTTGKQDAKAIFPNAAAKGGQKEGEAPAGLAAFKAKMDKEKSEKGGEKKEKSSDSKDDEGAPAAEKEAGGMDVLPEGMTPEQLDQYRQNAALGGGIGGGLGGAAGAYLAHGGSDTLAKPKPAPQAVPPEAAAKMGSFGEWSEFWDLALSGKLGEEIRQEAEAVVTSFVGNEAS